MNDTSGGWETSTGWCVDETGEKHLPHSAWPSASEKECFEVCKRSTSLNGCTTGVSEYGCITHSGTVVGGNGELGYKCHYRKGK